MASAKFLKVLFSWATKPEDCFCVITPTAALAIFGKGRLIFQVQMGSGFSVTLRENNLTSPILSRTEQNCSFSPRENRLRSRKSTI